jgi:hypothetical protein
VVHLTVEGLQAGHVHDLTLKGVRSLAGEPLLHDKAYYTLNYVPKEKEEGPVSARLAHFQERCHSRGLALCSSVSRTAHRCRQASQQ